MKKQFVSYEIALKLKELGFDEECLASYFVFGDGIARNGKYGQTDPMLFISDLNDKGRSTDDVSEELNMFAYHVIGVPLWQQVIDWFREKYNIHISIPNYYDGWSIDIRGFKQNINLEYHSEPGVCLENYHKTREQAILKALELCQT